MRIIPYVEIDGSRTLTDRQMFEIFEIMQKNGDFEKIFHFGMVKTWDQFIRFIKSESNTVFLAYDDKRPILISWVNETMGKRGIITFCTFSEIYIGKRLKAAKTILDLYFRHFEVLVGLIPETFETVLKFAGKLGFKGWGPIPHFSYLEKEKKNIGAYILYLTKEGVK